MVAFTADFLKNSAVTVTANFISKEVPLSAGVAEIARKNSLNMEQIKRLVEVVNQVTYLKILSTAKDRTFEFPLAKFEDVVGLLVTPEIQSMTDTNMKASPLQIIGISDEVPIEKVASDTGWVPSGQEKLAYLSKYYYSTRHRLEKIAEREITLLEEIKDLISECKSDESFMDKAACVTDGDEESLTKIAMLVYGEKRSFTGETLFYDTDLEQASKAVGLLKEAASLVEERKTLEDQMQKLAASNSIPNTFQNAASNIQGMSNKAAGIGKNIGKGAMSIGSLGLKLVDPLMAVATRSPRKQNIWKSLHATTPPIKGV